MRKKVGLIEYLQVLPKDKKKLIKKFKERKNPTLQRIDRVELEEVGMYLAELLYDFNQYCGFYFLRDFSGAIATIDLILSNDTEYGYLEKRLIEEGILIEKG